MTASLYPALQKELDRDNPQKETVILLSQLTFTKRREEIWLTVKK